MRVRDGAQLFAAPTREGKQDTGGAENLSLLDIEGVMPESYGCQWVARNGFFSRPDSTSEQSDRAP